MSVLRLERNYVKRCEGRGTWLRGDHAPKTRHVPRAHMVILGANGDKVFLTQHDFYNWVPMYHECLEELWSVAYCLGMLNDHSYRSRACTVCDLNPVTT